MKKPKCKEIIEELYSYISVDVMDYLIKEVDRANHQLCDKVRMNSIESSEQIYREIIDFCDDLSREFVYPFNKVYRELIYMELDREGEYKFNELTRKVGNLAIELNKQRYRI